MFCLTIPHTAKEITKGIFHRFPFQFPNTISHVIFLIYYLFLFHGGERMASRNSTKNYLFFWRVFLTVLLVIKQSSSLYLKYTYFVCLKISYYSLIFFSIEILSFHYFSAIFCKYLLCASFLLVAQQFLSCVFFCHRCLLLWSWLVFWHDEFLGFKIQLF